MFRYSLLLIFSVGIDVGVLSRGNQPPSGQPLLLSPFLENGRFDEALQMAKVVDPVFLGVESYSGFITVNKTYNSNTFFWFFPALNGDKGAPIVLNLQGGPGFSAMGLIFSAAGPFVVSHNLSLEISNTSWAHNHSMLFIENPVGTGFSFTNSWEGAAATSTQAASAVYTFLLQFFKLFPGYLKNDFYVWGVSYGGHFVPAMGFKIHEENRRRSPSQRINLRGLILESAWTDPINQIQYGDNLYNLGFLDADARDTFIGMEETMKFLIRQERYLEAYEIWAALLLFENSTLHSTTGLPPFAIYDYVNDKPTSQQFVDEDRILEFISQPQIRQSIHVGSLAMDSFTNWTVLEIMEADFMKSYKKEIDTLLDSPEGYRILYYNGQMDILVPFRGVEKMLTNFKWSGTRDYTRALRAPWFVDEYVIGYVKCVARLKYVFVRNAGHSVSYNQPLVANLIMNGFTSGVDVC